MKDQQCTEFLQWALPKLHMRWKGFRKVRKQVCKRIKRRLDELNLENTDAYRAYLEKNREEWDILDQFCRITISRFYRNNKIFEKIGMELFPMIYQTKDTVRCWSAGCASGEEPYSLSLIFFNLIKNISPVKEIEIVATDADSQVLDRAEKGCYAASTIKELPDNWIKNSFTEKEKQYCLKEELKQPVTFVRQDIRKEKPVGRFDLILCRNLVATYFDDTSQENVFREIADKLTPNGFLILGKNEKTNAIPEELEVWSQHERIFRKTTSNTVKTP